jgi:DNA modification methylase
LKLIPTAFNPGIVYAQEPIWFATPWGVMFTGNSEDHAALIALRQAALDNEPVSGLTHRHYKYPARFSPRFVRTAIESFSNPGDLVLDPYMGGGTTLVEAMALGRRSIGCDINSLAVFVARAKTSILSSKEKNEVQAWVTTIVPVLSYHDIDPRLEDVICEKRTYNLQLPNVRPIKKFVALALISLEAMRSKNSQEFARCALLNVAQWALNGRRHPVTLKEFRDRVTTVALEMLVGSAAINDSLPDGSHRHLSPILIHDSAENIAKHSPFQQGERVNLVVTSPPYPGVHVLYHRWQVNGRRETPAPYWIANCFDGESESYYTFGKRSEKHDGTYFEQSLKTLQATRSVMRDGGIMIQMIAFSRPRTQLKRYLDNMTKAGFREVRTEGNRPVRTWRDVPGRNWHANFKGETSSAREVALLHVAA